MKLNRSYFLSIILLCFSLSVEAQGNYSAMYVFGDSLSDTGNLAAYLHSTGVLDPSKQLPFPYYQNRISNGPVAVDHIAETLALPVIPSLLGGTNYAVAGAKASGDALADLPAQLELFVANHSVAGVTDIPKDALYIVYIGGNDVRAARGEIDVRSARMIIRKAVDNIGYAVRALISAGARHIMVVNSPDIGKIPETLMAAEAGIVWLPALSTWRTKQFNFRLFLTLMRVQWETGVKLVQYNLFRTFNQMLENSVELGFTNSTEACFYSEKLEEDMEPLLLPFNEACMEGDFPNLYPNFEPFFFFDEIHPTTRVHALLGQDMLTRLASPFPVFANAR